MYQIVVLMELDKQLYAEIKEYCELNGLKPRDFVHEILKKAFMEEKYGKMPAVIKKSETFQPKTSIEIIQVSEEAPEKEEVKEEIVKEAEQVVSTPETTEKIEATETVNTERKQTVKKRKL